jgi:hypothetical protein
MMFALIKGAKFVEIHQTTSSVPDGCALEAVGTDIVVHLVVNVSVSSGINL